MKPTNPFDRAVARRLVQKLRKERLMRQIAENQNQALTKQLDELHTTFATARGNINKVDESFEKLIRHYRKQS